MAPSFLMDRDKPGASETQMGFFDFVVMKLCSVPLCVVLHRQSRFSQLSQRTGCDGKLLTIVRLDMSFIKQIIYMVLKKSALSGSLADFPSRRCTAEPTYLVPL